MSMTIIRPGLVSTIQDLGRYGYQASGFAPTGALDSVSMRRANALVGNAPSEAVLEMMLLGITAKFTSDCVIALTGANMSPRINGETIANGTAVQVGVGDTLELSGATGGMCCYLAVAGGFDIQVVMGSRSTGMRFAVGGFEGRKLSSGDVIAIKNNITDLPNLENRRLGPLTAFTKHVTLRAIPGPQDDMFGSAEVNEFFSRPYAVTNAMDRMGIRLEGEPIVPIKGSDIVSDGTVFGAVQVPTGGQPIILMADRQTTGGYAKIATVITADLPKAAQMTPGSTVRFVRVTVEEAQDILQEQNDMLAREYKRLNG